MSNNSLIPEIPRISNQPRNWIKDYFGIPYPFKESVGVIWRNLAGPRRSNPCRTEFIPQHWKSSKSFDISNSITIGFIGDIMDMEGRQLTINPDVSTFFSDCDFLIGNFEATIVDKKSRGLQQRHIPQIQDALASLFPPKKTFLSVANNHAGDFPKQVFEESLEKLRNNGFRIFGLSDCPFVDINDSFRIVTGTWWANVQYDFIADFHDILNYYDSDMYNILYPHWGFEMELYPRKYLNDVAKSLLSKYKMILGHHSHTPQPISLLNHEGSEHIVAYSLGDFCNGLKYDMYRFGMVVKSKFICNKNSGWDCASTEWKFVECIPDPTQLTAQLCLRSSIPYFPNVK
jgi:hypothetical protein